MTPYLKKLSHFYIWKRIFYERLTEPLHLNFLSLFVLLFGTLRMKIAFDLVLRNQHAFCLLEAADQAKKMGYFKVSVFEFGVAAGAGLINIQEIAKKITSITGVSFDIYGLDTGKGMPPPKSYKDHPDLYQSGDFPMDLEKLERKLEVNTNLIIGEISDQLASISEENLKIAPVGFISIDVDYYSSTVDALRLLKINPQLLLPRVLIYLDDLQDMNHNSYCGELGAVNDFTSENIMRPIERHTFLRGYRIFKSARWIDHIFQCHVLDHPVRSNLKADREKTILTNPYL